MARKRFASKWNELQEEANKAWEWLRKLPEYRRDSIRFCSDYNKATNGKRLRKLSAAFEKKWCFYPEPDQLLGKHAPTGFALGLGRLFDRDPFCSGVELKEMRFKESIHPVSGLNEQDRLGLPEYVLLKVNPQLPLHVILDGVEAAIKTLRKLAGVKDVRPQSGNLYRKYQVYVLNRLGRSRREIDRVLFPSKETLDAQGDCNSDPKVDYRRAYRLRKSVAKQVTTK